MVDERPPNLVGMENPVRTLLAAVCGLAAAVALAPTAAAYPTDPANDRAFCQSLAAQGYPMDCGTAVVMALGQCNHFATGKTYQDAMRTTYQMTGDKGLAPFMLSGAVSFYCPEYVDRLPADAQAAYYGTS